LPYIARYEKQIAEQFDSHPDNFLFRDLPGAGAALAPRLLTAFGSDRDRFESAAELASLSGIAPVRKASGKSVTVQVRSRMSEIPAPVLPRVWGRFHPLLPLGESLL
jgi:transposase